MKAFSLALLLLLVAASTAAPQSGSDDTTQLGVTLDQRLTDAWQSGKWTTLEPLIAPDYQAITEDADWNLATLKTEFPKVRLRDFKIEKQTVRRLAYDLILVNDVFTMHETYNNQDISGRYSSSDIWVRRNNRHWLLLVEQEVRLRDK
jgi:Domain of unknown function (DUF4440)